MFTAAEQRGMTRAIELAAGGGIRTFPNPLVGAVVLRDETFVSEGFHACCGGPHAEVEALRRAGPRAKGATLVVTLEPCCHTGRTGPCVSEIISSGVARVVAAMQDPDPRVSGRGFEALRAAGVEVETGLMGAEARNQNLAYLHFLETGRSLVLLKMAVTLDGKVAAADGSSRWITGDEARARVKEMRAASSVVLVGAGTVRADDPGLLAGPPAEAGNTPVRMVLSRTGDLDIRARIFDGCAPLVVAMPAGADPRRVDSIRKAGAEVWELPRSPEGGADLGALLTETASKGWGWVLCEGGAGLATELLRAGLADRVSVFVSPAFLGGEGMQSTGTLGIAGISEAIRLEGVEFTTLGGDVLVEGRIVHRAR